MTVLTFAVALRYHYALAKRVQVVEEKVFYADLCCTVPGLTFGVRFTNLHYKLSYQPRI